MDQLHTDIDPSESTNCFYAADAQARIMPDIQIINIWDNALYVGTLLRIMGPRGDSKLRCIFRSSIPIRQVMNPVSRLVGVLSNETQTRQF
jgi:hypothetical protein